MEFRGKIPASQAGVPVSITGIVIIKIKKLFLINFKNDLDNGVSW
jgi:hypothetical protein